MQAAVRPYLNAGIAMIGAGVIAAAPIAPPPMEIEVPKISSAAVSLAAAASPLEAYAALLNNTFTNTGTLASQAFSSGVAPILQQLIVNQLTFVQGLNTAFNEIFSSANPSGVPALLQKALSELAAGQIQTAAETLATGVIQVAFPVLPTLLQPLNNLVAVVNLLPDIALLSGIAVISPPLALVQATGAALQSVVNAISTGDFGQFVSAVLSAPAVMLDGLLNGYQPTQTGGLLTPGLGTLGILVNIRDMIANAINPAAVTATTTDEATMVTLDVAPTESAVDEAATAETTTSDEVTAAPEDEATVSTDEVEGAVTAETVSVEKAAAQDVATEEEATAEEAPATDAEVDAATETGDAADVDTPKNDTDTKADTTKPDTTKADAGTGDKAEAGDDSKAGADNTSGDSGDE